MKRGHAEILGIRRPARHWITKLTQSTDQGSTAEPARLPHW